MAKPLSVKRIQISKSQSVILLSTALAAFLLVFSVVASKALVDQISYNNRVIAAKKKAVTQLRTNTQTAQQLVTSYKAFASTSKNVIGGNPQGTGARDGDNAKIVLDALPSKYDFPALTTSLEAMLLSQKLEIASITGSDDEVAQNANHASPSPVAIEIPFQLSATGTYSAIQSSLDVFGKSIRPFQIQTLELSGGQNSMTMSVTGKSYYQPVKSFSITKKVIK